MTSRPLLAALLLALGTAAPAQDPSRPPPLVLPADDDISPAAWQLRYIAWRAASDAKDEATFRQFFAPDLINLQFEGPQYGLEDWVRQITEGDDTPPGNRRTTQIVSVTGNRYEVTVRERYETNSPYPTSYGPHYRRWVVFADDTWRRTSRGWRMFRSESVEGLSYCDDQLVARDVGPALRGPRNLPFHIPNSCVGYDLRGSRPIVIQPPVPRR